MSNTPATPYELLGGRDEVVALVERFYDAMEQFHPALAALHPLDDEGRVSRESRDRFAMFLIGWLGGPQDYVEQFGHPRLRMRHAKVPVDIAMRDAWLDAMAKAMDARGIDGDLRAFLDHRLADVADFMRNKPE